MSPVNEFVLGCIHGWGETLARGRHLSPRLKTSPLLHATVLWFARRTSGHSFDRVQVIRFALRSNITIYHPGQTPPIFCLAHH